MASTPTVRAYTGANSACKIRALGPEMEDTLEESPPSMLIEGESEDLFKRMEQRMEQLEQRVHLLEDHNHILQDEQTMLLLFIEDGQQLSLRAFVDKILQFFYVAAGVDTMNFEEKSKWLFSHAAEEFVDCGGNLVLLGQGSITRDRATLALLRKLRSVSKTASRVACHSAKPIQVAYALDKLPNVDSSLHHLFEMCFGMKAKDMIQALEARKALDPFFTTQFHL